MEDSLSNVSAFVLKLWKMLNQEATDVIYWNSSGKSFIIQDQALFITKILPSYFKHNNMSSFIRQLNLYDFHKISNNKCSGIEYQHEFFQRDRDDLLKFIRRKSPQHKKLSYSPDDSNVDVDLVTLSKEINLLTKKHDEMEKQLNSLQQENILLNKAISGLQSQVNNQTQILKIMFEIVVPFVENCKVRSCVNKNEATFNGATKIAENAEIAKKLDVLHTNYLYNGNEHVVPVVPSIECLREASPAHLQSVDNNNIILYTPYSVDQTDHQTQAVSGFMEPVISTDDITSNINQFNVLHNNIGTSEERDDKIYKNNISCLESELSTLLDGDVLDGELLNSSNNYT